MLYQYLCHLNLLHIYLFTGFISSEEWKSYHTNYQRTINSTELHLINWRAGLKWFSIAICSFYDEIRGFSIIWMIITDSNAIHIFLFIGKVPDFSVQNFQFIVGSVSVLLCRMYVFIVFPKVIYQWIVLIFICSQKFPFVNFRCIDFLFEINDQIFNRFLAYWHIMCGYFKILCKTSCIYSVVIHFWNELYVNHLQWG